MITVEKNLRALTVFVFFFYAWLLKRLKQVRRITVITQGISESETDGCLETV